MNQRTFVLLGALLSACGSDVRLERLPHRDGSTSPCADVTCPAPRPCELPGVCDPDEGVCVYAKLTDATPCDDGNACTYGDACEDGVCEGGAAVVCRAPDDCHAAGVCDPELGCQIDVLPDGTGCEDGNPCTDGDVCASGSCGGEPKECSAAGECQVGQCNAATGECEVVAAPDGTTCSEASDGHGPSVCEELTCVAGSCRSTPKDCPAIDGCHGPGTCDPASGACSTPELADGTACDDGDVCTDTDSCSAGVCQSGAPVVCPTDDDPCFAAPECVPGVGCVRALAPNGVLCDDDNACTRTDTCFFGECRGADEVVCAPRDACHLSGVCDQTTGLCTSPPRPEGSACDDGNACTYNTSCVSGQCGGGDTIACAAPTACQEAPSCDAAQGCVYQDKADGTPCETGDLCSVGDACVAGACVAGAPVVCPPTGDPCTSSACNGETGACELIPLGSNVSCNDGNFCTINDHCEDGQCTGGSVLYCPPRECIAVAICSPADGTCGGVPEPDGTSCVLDEADPCAAQSACDDGVCRVSRRISCTPLSGSYGSGVCDSATGTCTNPCKVTTPCTSGFCFTDVTYSLSFGAAPVAGTVSGPAAGAVLDFDADGWTDILVTTEDGLMLLHNDRDGFSDVTAEAGLTGTSAVTGVVTADYDNDGLTDVYVLSAGQNQLYRNQGTSGARNFSIVTLGNPAGVGYSTDAAFGDFDGDGRLDLFVTNSGPDAAHETDGAPNQLYRYRRDTGTFEEVALTGAATLNSQAALLTDATGDGLVDLLECNQTGVRLYRQASAGHTFQAPTDLLSLSNGRCEALAAGDYDRDGDLDYYAPNSAGAGANSLLVNGGGTFSAAPASTGVGVTQDGCNTALNPPSWDASFQDFDADGLAELFVANGAIDGDSPLGNALFEFDTTTRQFTNVGANARVDDSRRGRAALVLDYDNDGDSDLFVINERATAALLRNDHNDATTPGSYLRVLLDAGRSNADALGARLRVSAGGVQQTLEVNRATRGDGRLLFGVPAGASKLDIEARWPSGTVQRRFDVPVTAFVKSDQVDGFHPPAETLHEPVVTPLYDSFTWTDVLDADGGAVSSTLDLDLGLQNVASARDVQVVVELSYGATSESAHVSKRASANATTSLSVTFELDETTTVDIPATLTVTVTDGDAVNQLRQSLTLTP